LSKSEIFWTRPFICAGSAIFSLTAHGGVSTFGQTVEVRGGLRWERLELPPGNREYTVPDIEGLADKFKDIEAELYKIRRSLEPKMTDAEIRAASSFLRAP
jgi:hypothetical protein